MTLFGYSIKKIVLWGGGSILVLFIGLIILGSIVGPPEKSQTEEENISPPVTESAPVVTEKEKSDGLVLVVRVIDGDTIELEGGQRVRYIGIDTPETVDPRKPVQCFGKEASDYNKQLVEGKRVHLEKDITESDKYDRLLRYVYINDTFVNLSLVQDGYAYSYSYPPDVKYQDRFVEAQRVAREQKKGLWGACPVVSPTPTPTPSPAVAPSPASTPSAQESVPTPSSCAIKGNISSGGKIYHLPGCNSYEQTEINEVQGEKWFCTEGEAIAAGWRKAKNCP